MVDPDEPMFASRRRPPPRSTGKPLGDEIAGLTASQNYAVLCTQGDGQPYGSLVAFAFTGDLRRAVFATLKSTRKYRLLSECDHVALVVDDRPENPTDMMHVQAVTATGRAVELRPGDERDELVGLLLAKHGYLRSFVESPTCALFRVDIVRCFHVTRFQEVREWTPPRRP